MGFGYMFDIIQMKVVYLLLAIAAISLAETEFTLIKNTDPAAKCLDGSTPALYFHAGTESDKFLIYFQSGGLCRGDGLADMLEHCYRRSFTDLGSSTTYPPTRSFDNWAFLAPDDRINPFHTWNRIFIPYCDGSLHTGSKLDAIKFKDRSLYFRGSNNTIAHFNLLNERYNLFSATNITITGTSAGGVAAFVWSNYVYERSKNPEGVLIIPDSGTMILDFPNMYDNKTLIDYTIETYKLVLEETKMPLTECIKKYPSQIQCFQSGNLYEFIKPRLFILQSQYDSWGLIQVLQFRCVPNVNPSNLTTCNDSQRAYIERYREKINEGMKNFTSVERFGVWSISCVQHGFLQNSLSYVNSFGYRTPANYGKTILVAISNYLTGGNRAYIDDVNWPNNQGCNGLSNFQEALQVFFP